MEEWAVIIIWKPIVEKTMRALPPQYYGEIKWLANKKNETQFTEKLVVVFKIIYLLFIFSVAPLEN
jgi:uncharacterized membrane protein YkvA (DUF1232 family)